MVVDVLGQLVCSWFKIVQIVPKKLFQMFIGLKLDLNVGIYYNSATSPMKHRCIDQQRKQ